MTWAVVVSAVGVAVATASSYQQAQSAKAQAKYQQQVAYNNSIIAQQNAADVRDRGKRDKEEHRDRIAQSKGSVKGDQAALGFLIDDPGSTNVDLLADIAEAGALDLKKIEENTAAEERRALIQGDNFVAQAGLYGLKASAQNAGLAAGGTLLSGAGNVFKAGKSAGYKWAGGAGSTTAPTTSPKGA
tara:strand:+ start:2649 stop:3209 length:561 start_codon:yes stop_codon:yes gene_type:complete